MNTNTTIKIAILDTVLDIDRLIFVEVEPDLVNLQKLVGGYLETWPLTQSAHLYFDEEGALKGLKPNRLANEILPTMYSEKRVIDGIVHPAPPLPALVGPVLIVGSQEPTGQPDGEEHSISRRIAQDLTLIWLGRNPIARVR